MIIVHITWRKFDLMHRRPSGCVQQRTHRKNRNVTINANRLLAHIAWQFLFKPEELTVSPVLRMKSGLSFMLLISWSAWKGLHRHGIRFCFFAVGLCQFVIDGDTITLNEGDAISFDGTTDRSIRSEVTTSILHFTFASSRWCNSNRYLQIKSWFPLALSIQISEIQGRQATFWAFVTMLVS